MTALLFLYRDNLVPLRLPARAVASIRLSLSLSLYLLGVLFLFLTLCVASSRQVDIALVWLARCLVPVPRSRGEEQGKHFEAEG